MRGAPPGVTSDTYERSLIWHTEILGHPEWTMKRAGTPYDRVLYHEGPLQIGRFWLPVGDEHFADTGPIENHVVVIPTWALEISYPDHEPVVADPTRAMFYNEGCIYRRRALNPHGDLALWIAFDAETLAEAIGTSPDHPFPERWAPLPRDAFVVARALAAEFDNGYMPDALQIEDCAWWLLGRCAGNEHTTPRSTARQRRAVANAEAFIAEHFHEPITLSGIADAAHMSPFHLSRLFHRLTGTRLHQRLTELRLRCSVHEIIESQRSLTDIASDLGFSSASHFSNAFRSRFGLPPSRLRGREAALRILGERDPCPLLRI